MQKIEIQGMAKLEVIASYKDSKLSYGTIKMNGKEFGDMVASHVLGSDSDNNEHQRLEQLVKVSIVIEPVAETLKINGNEVPMEG